MYADLIKYCRNNGIRYLIDEPMSLHTTFRIGGNADIFVFANSEQMLGELIKYLKKSNIPYFLIGRGSNLLVSDSGIRKVVISLEEMNNISVDGNVITAQSGATLSGICKFAAENGLSGIEFAYGIPASVGGAIFMNAGAYGGEIKDIVLSVKCMDENGEVLTLNTADLEFSYRSSIFKKNKAVILSVCFLLNKSEKNEIREKMNSYINRRKEKQPLELPSAGSTFKRPEGYFAGTLIEQSGLKGFTVGGAQVSTKHAGFVVNTGCATCDDVLAVIENVKKTVFKNSGVILEPEVIFIGD